ncbi:hypothetical protein SNEBB_006598 [Seison nebaliae]|nr:hypothetical protein SNEBB_006598 [Seison nebaliae]
MSIYFQICILLFISSIRSELNDGVYLELNGFSTCISRLSKSKVYGCGGGTVEGLISTDESSIGTIYLLRSLSLLDFKFLKYKQAVLIFDNYLETSQFSPASTCTNLMDDCFVNWNSYGLGMISKELLIPLIFIGNKTEQMYIQNCITNQESDNKCSIKYETLMAAVGNSKVCLRRNSISHTLQPTSNFCDPLGDNSIYSLFPPLNISEEENPKFLLISVNIDRNSLFTDIDSAFATQSIDSSLLLMITKKLFDSSSLKSLNSLHIIFMFFNGESYRFMASKRFVYEMGKSKLERLVPGDLKQLLNMSSIVGMIEFNELFFGFQDPDNITLKLMFFNVKTDYQKGILQSLVNQFKSEFDLDQKEYPPEKFPPSSILSFLSFKHIAFFVFVDREQLYENPYIASPFDSWSYQLEVGDDEFIDETNFTITMKDYEKNFDLFSDVMVKFIQQITGNQISISKSSNWTTTKLLYCLSVNYRCDLLQTIYRKDDYEGRMNSLDSFRSKFHDVIHYRLSGDIGVYGLQPNTTLRYLIHQLLVYSTSINQSLLTPYNETFLAKNFFQYQLSSIRRLYSRTYVIPSLSIGFNSRDTSYDAKEAKDYDSDLWMESTWNSRKLSVYVKSSNDLTIFIIGCVISLVSALITLAIFFSMKKNDYLKYSI